MNMILRVAHNAGGRMFGLRRKKPKDGDEEHRYYLLPGMGRSNRRYRNKIQLWSIIAGIIGSALIGTALWLLNG